MPISSTSRREFLRRTISTTAAAGVAPYFVPSRLFAQGAEHPSDRLSLGVIGLGSRGFDIGTTLAPFGNVVAACDIDNNACWCVAGVTQHMAMVIIAKCWIDPMSMP
jgi:hypothetical protein